MTMKNRGTQRQPTAEKIPMPTETAAIIDCSGMEILSHRSTRPSIRVIFPKRRSRPNDGANTASASVHDPPFYMSV